MDVACNMTVLEAQEQINSTIYHLIKMVSMCASYSLNTMLSVPLLIVIPRSPSLLRHTRFLLLVHFLLCNNLQQLIRTIKAVQFSGMFLLALLGHACRSVLHYQSLCHPDPPGRSDILFSVPVIVGSYPIPGYLHNDAIDIATTIIYNLGVSLVPLVYGSMVTVLRNYNRGYGKLHI